MNRENQILEKLIKRFGEIIKNPKVKRKRRIFIELDAEDLRDVLSYVRNELGFDHISTITGIDLKDEIELIYHLAYEHSIELSIKTKIPKDDPKIKSIVDLYPAAGIYEREVHDLLGVVFDGNPDLSPLLLPDNWPKGIYPLRKDRSFEEIKALLEKRREEK